MTTVCLLLAACCHFVNCPLLCSFDEQMNLFSQIMQLTRKLPVPVRLCGCWAHFPRKHFCYIFIWLSGILWLTAGVCRNMDHSGSNDAQAWWLCCGVSVRRFGRCRRPWWVMSLLFNVITVSCRLGLICFLTEYHKRPLNQAWVSFDLVCGYVTSFLV